jgi:MinD-like ATPase involved in chromosome partitioning or flagellar assembly
VSPRNGSAPIETLFTGSHGEAGVTTPTQRRTPVLPAPAELGLIRAGREIPRRGWRKALHDMSGGWLNPGESAHDSRDRVLADRVNKPVRGTFSIAVMSMKGGAGKTTTTVGLGSALAMMGGDRVVAVDANPDLGTLAQRGAQEMRSTVRDLLAAGEIDNYADIRRHTAQGASRLEILGSERDPAVSEGFSQSDYLAVHRILDRFYNIILTDCGTGLTHSAMQGVLDAADALVIVASPAIDSARSALATLDWLDRHGHADLVAGATVVLSSARPGPAPVDLAQMTRYFRSQQRPVFVIPFDRHLAEGGEIAPDRLHRKTRRAYLEAAAALVDAFVGGPGDR